MQRHPTRRSHLLTAMLFSLVAVGAMCVFVAATSGLHIQTEFLDIQLGPDNGDQVVIGTQSPQEVQSNAPGETTIEDASTLSPDLVDKTTDFVDQITCPTDSVCLSSVVKDTSLGETLDDLVDDLVDGVPSSSLGDPLGDRIEETVDDALGAESLGDAVDEVVEGVEETADDLLDEVEDIVEDLGDEVEDIVDDLLGGLGLGD